MSRNKEKNQSHLHRYYAQQERDAGVLETNPALRPKYVQKVNSLPHAERWRLTVLTEISVKLTDINDPSLGLDEIRSLNDTLNKLQREKRAWEYHIRKLGGADYSKQRNQVQGMIVNGIRYYGRARELPEASCEKVMLEEAKEEPHIPLAYYDAYGQTWNKPIVADLQYVQGEVNGALGEKIFPVESIPLKAGDLPTNKDVERMLLERQKAQIRAQLQG